MATIKDKQLNALLVKACKVKAIADKHKKQLDALVDEIKTITRDMGMLSGSYETIATEFTLSYTAAGLDVDKDKLKEKYPEIYAEVFTKPTKERYALKSYKLKANSKAVTVQVK